MYSRRQEAHFLGELATQRLDALEQFTILVGINQRHQAVTDFKTQHVDWLDVIPAGFYHGRHHRVRDLIDYQVLL